MQMIRFTAGSPRFSVPRLVCALALTLVSMFGSVWAQTSQQDSQNNSAQSDNNSSSSSNATTSRPTDDAAPSGPTRLRTQQQSPQQSSTQGNAEKPLPPVRYVPGEFERYVQTRMESTPNSDIRRFGQNLMIDPAGTGAQQDPLPSIPGDYIIKSGDEVALTLWGSIDADLRLTVDRSGMISVPRVGSINVAGIRYAELSNTIKHRVGQVFKNFELSATLGQLRPIRVFVTGYAQRPGSLTVSGLSSVLHVLMRAGGPSAAGGFRDIRVTRQGHLLASFDLYDLLLRGDRGTDLLVQPDDVIFIGPIGTQVAVVGSVNQQAIFELKPGETMDDLLRFAGGFNAVADRTRVAIERLGERERGRVAEVRLPTGGSQPLGTGDLVRAFSAVASALPQDRQNRRVWIEGEVRLPGEYVLPPGATVADALRSAGGMIGAAFPFGTEFTRESVRVSQQANYDRALRDLETDMTKNQASQRSTSAEETAAQAAAAASNSRLIERLRQVRPTGRMVLQVRPQDHDLPDLALEDGDRINVPTRGTTVGVFGSVFNTGSFVYSPEHTTGEYLALAGGPTRGADKDSMFVIRANGSVVSALQGSSFWHSNNEFRSTVVQPGDTIFVPEELNKSTFVQSAKDWTQILYQFGLGVAGIKTLGL